MKNVILKCGKLEVEFLFGNCILIYRDIHLTKELGLYSSIFYNGKWYDSRYAQWRIVENKKNRKILYGEWINMPHRQTWILESPASDVLRWFIKCEGLDDFPVEMIQQNYMLTDLYNFWKVEGYAEGRFPEYFANYKGLLWDRMWSMPQRKGMRVFLVGGQDKIKIPEIVCSPLSSRDDILMVIENADPGYSARIIQLLFVNKNKEESPGCQVTLTSELKVENETN